MALAGEVLVDGKLQEKAGSLVARDAEIAVRGRQPKYATRAGFKLAGALDDFSLDPSGLTCLDLGAAHGGFTDCLLQRGAARVYAVDVNIEQLEWKLRQDPRVVPIARNARELGASDIPEPVDLVVIDVSFISVRKVLPPATRLAKPGAHLLILVKPQFELPRRKIAPGGIVRDEKLHHEAIAAVQRQGESLGLACLGFEPSCLAGAEGNLEYFLHTRKVALE